MNNTRFPPPLRRLTLIVLVAALYYATAHLGLRIALPPGIVTAFWPPSGIALASILVFGWQMGLGVFAGALLVNWGRLSGPNALPLAAAIAAASTLQAWLAAALLRRWVKPFPPAAIRATLVSVAILAVVTLLAPVIGTTSLCAARFASWSSFTTQFSTWWLGDFFGILLFAPGLVMLLMRVRRQEIRQLVWPITYFFIGAALFTFMVIQNSEQQQLAKEVRHDLTETMYLLDSRLDQEIHSLVAVRAAYDASGGFTRENFLTFTRPLVVSSPATTAIEWVPLVKAADRAAFEQSMRAGGFANFFIFERDALGGFVPAGQRAEYFPVTWIEPFTPNQAAFGFDLGSNALRLETIVAARDSGVPAASPPVVLVQNAAQYANPTTSIIMMQAVYQNGLPTQTAAERRAALAGFSVVVFQVKDLLSVALASAARQDLEIYLYDMQEPDQPRFLAFYPSITGPQTLPAAGAPAPAALYTTGYQAQPLLVGGRSWLMIVRPGSSYAAGKTGSVSWILLGTGLLGVALFLAFENKRMKNQAVLAQSEARYRLISENTGDAIWILDIETRAFKFVSPSVEKMIGYSVAELLRLPFTAILSSDSRERIEALLPVRIATFYQNPKNCAYTDEFDQIHKNGSIVHVDISTTYITDEDGHLQMVGITRDITERRHAQESVQESLGKLNAALASMTDAVVISDRACQITHTNSAYATYHRFASLEEFAQSFEQNPNLIEVFLDGAGPLPPEMKPIPRALGGEVGVNIEYGLRRTDTGETWTGAYSFAPILDAAGAVSGAVAVARDITETKQAALLQDTVYRIAEAAQAAGSLEDVFEQIHAQISRVMYADVFYIALYDEYRGLLRFAYAVDPVNPPEFTFFPPGQGLTEMVLRTGKPLLCDANCMEKLIAEGELVHNGQACQAWLGVPLTTRGKTIGVLSVLHYSDPHIFKERERLILEYVSSQVATAIERKQASDLLQKQRANLETAQSIAHLGSWELEPQSGRGLTWSREMFELFQCDPALGVPPLDVFMQLVHPDDRQPLLDAQQRAIDTGKLISQDYRAFPGSQMHGALVHGALVRGGQLAEAQLRYFKANLHAVKDEAGTLLSMSGTVLDVTETRRMEEQIKDRVKELTCLFRVSRLLKNRHQPVEKACESIVVAIIPAMRFPQLAAPVLELDGRRYGSTHITGMPTHGLHAEIATDGQHRGCASVYYTKDAPFALPEEQNLLDNSARMLGLWLEQRESEAAIQAAQYEIEELNRTLEKRVDERTAEVRQSEATYRALFENSNDGIFLIDLDGRYITANQRGLDSLGYTLEEFFAVTRDTKNAMAAPEQRPDGDEHLAAALHGEFVPLYERTLVGKNGKRGEVEINLSPVRDPSGRVVMVQSVVRDISERKRAEDTLRVSRDRLSAANAALEKASRLKDEFLASMSHELRTPLTGILGLSEALQTNNTYGILNEKQLKALRNIENSGRHLLELINDILDLSKIEAGKLVMQFEPCSVGEICQAALYLTKGMASQKQIHISYTMNPASIQMRADPRRVKQMLVNLLSNAIKFTPAGGSAGLEVTASREEQSICLSVWDYGIGIQPEEMGKLFKPFSQIDSSLARQYSGTGLGLSLVMHMAEMHGGSIAVESTFGTGSRFTIHMPWTPDPLPGKQPPTFTPEAMGNTLTIEDNFLDAEHLTRYLQEMGITNLVHPTAAGALITAALLQPSAILLDLHLADGDGMRLLGALKADERTRAIPVIIASVDERVSEAYQAGALGYLVKPFSRDELHTELAKASVFQKKSEPVLVIHVPKGEVPQVSAPLDDGQGATAPEVTAPAVTAPLVLQADDNEANLEMIGDYLEGQGLRVAATRSGYELLERAPELHPDLMLVDIQMPILDGMETIRRLRAHADPLVARTPIIALTALAMVGDRERCLAAGANEYLSKPVSLRQLTELIRRMISSTG